MVMEFGVRSLEVQESGLDQDPYQKKYTFTSITRVLDVQIEQMRGHLESLSARILMSSEFMVTCASGLLPNPAKSHISNIDHDGTLSFRNFIMMVKNSSITILRLYALHWPMAMIRSKSQKFKIGYYDGILSIRNFILQCALMR
jgi:hypothetical protein